MAKVQHARGNAEEAKKFATRAVAGFKAASNQVGEAVATHTLARITLSDFKKESYEEAATLADGAKDLFQKAKNGKGEAATLSTLAKIKFVQGDVDGAMAAADMAATLFEAVEEKLGQASALT